MDPQDVKTNLVLILDFGSQYTHLITRRIRALNVFSLCINGTSSLKSIADLNPRVIILSGGPHSVHSMDAPCFPSGFMEYVESNKVHVLGICYGLQLIVQKTGGEVRVGEKQEYGRMEIEVEKACGLFGNKKVGDRQSVWMSHGDEAVKLQEGFEVVARSKQGSVAAVENREKRLYGLQYHPEGVLVFLAAKSGLIKNTEEAAEFQNSIICVEMLIAAVGNLYAFPCKEYAGANIGISGDFSASIAHALKLNDFYHDTVNQVTHSPEGMETLGYFLFDICGVTAGWKMEDVLEEELKILA